MRFSEMPGNGNLSFYEILTQAVADFAQRGYVSETQLAYWIDRIRMAARTAMLPEAVMVEHLRRTFREIYERLVDRERILDQHSDIERFRLRNVKPELRVELNRRIRAAADLIRLNREASVEKTIQRFSGWATSVPPGGSDMVRRREVKSDVRKALAQLPFHERRVLIDQAHKFAANLSDILAVGGGTIAAEWKHHYVSQPRPKHVARSGEIFLIRNSWAQQQGLVKPTVGYTDDIEKPGELVNCRCTYRYLYNLRQLPVDMLTVKGRAALANLRLVA